MRNYRPSVNPTQNNQTEAKKIFKISILIALALLLWSIGKRVVNGVSTALSINTSNNQTPQIIQQIDNAQLNGGVRIAIVKGIAEFVKSAGEGWIVNDTGAVKEMNRLLNKQEVVWISTYFQNQYGTSLKSYLEKMLNSDWNPASWISKSGYRHLNKIVRDNIF